MVSPVSARRKKNAPDNAAKQKFIHISMRNLASSPTKTATARE